MNPLFSRLVTPIMMTLSLCIAPLSGWAGDVEFGQIASQTNPASVSLSKNMALGIQVYFNKVNANGGVQGSKLTLTTLDDGLQAPKMLELTQQLIDKQSIVGLIGFINSAGLAEITKQDLPRKNDIALIAPLQGDKHIVGAANVFPLRSSYTDEVTFLLKEAKKWEKDTLAIVNMNIAFGPALAQVANQLSGAQGVKIVTQNVLDVAPDKLDASIRAALAAIKQTNPKAILLLASGKPAAEFVKGIRDTPAGAVQIYGVSVLSSDVLVNAVGKDKARGIVISQALPFPFVASTSAITEYQNDMKKYAPGEPFSYPSLEGYLGAKIAAEGVRRAGKNPTRSGLAKALSTLGEYNLGGIFVNYSAAKRIGWGGVELSIINASGNLQK